MKLQVFKTKVIKSRLRAITFETRKARSRGYLQNTDRNHQKASTLTNVYAVTQMQRPRTK